MDILALLDLRLCIVFVLVLLLSVYLLSGPWNQPPSIWGDNVIFGHALEWSASIDFPTTLVEYRRKFGDLFRIRVGTKWLYVVNGPKLLREAFVKKSEYLSGRPDWMYVPNKRSQSKGIIFNLHDWKFTRKFAISSMRDFGGGKSTIEQSIHSEIEVLTEEFNKHAGKPFNCQILLGNAVSNIICGIVFGKRFDYDDKDFASLIGIINGNFKDNTLARPINYIPLFAADIIFKLINSFSSSKGTEVFKRFKSMRQFLLENIDQHRVDFDPSNLRDFTDLYLLSEQEEGASKIDEEDAFNIILDLFLAGTETTSTTLQWLMIYMMYNQDVQEKCRQEIHQVIGSERLPSATDKGTLLYTEATLLEVQRMATIVPLALPHVAKIDVKVGDFTIPKDSLVIPHIYTSHYDAATWGDPDNFRPERWISDEGKLINHQAFVPFSLGKRACAGENLAKQEMFLFTVAFLQRFKFKMTEKLPCMLGIQGATHLPKEFNVICESAV